MKTIVFTAWLPLLVSVMVFGCTPRAAPSAPAPQAAPATPAPPVAAPTPKADEAVWAKVVEAAKGEGKVSGYSSVLFTGPAGDALAKAFKEKYGIAVEFISGASPSQMERVRTEFRAGKLATSFQAMSQTSLLFLRSEGMLEPWGDLPNLAYKDTWFSSLYDEKGFLISWGKYWVATNVNTNLVKPQDEPKSYLDLLVPRWKGKIVSVEPGTPMLAVTYASLKYHKVLDVEDYFGKLGKQEVSFRAAGPDGTVALARGEKAIYVSPHETYVNAHIAEGAPIRPVYFKEGAPLRNVMAFALIKGGPHSNAARLLVNWLLSAEGENIYARAKQTSPNRKDVEEFSPTSKLIAPQAKTYWVQNEWIDNEASRLLRDKDLHKLLGVE